MYREETFLKRYPGNPILRPDMLPGAEAMMNGCPFIYKNKIHLLQPVIWRNKEFTSMHVCDSDDGIHFNINPEPFIQAGVDPAKVDGWAFAKVETKDDSGKTIFVDKLLKPFNLK